MALRLLFVMLLAGCSAGRAGSACARHSDCQIGLVCGALGVCTEAPLDAGVDDADLVDADTVDGDRTPPTPDAAIDAAIDPPVDAAVDGSTVDGSTVDAI